MKIKPKEIFVNLPTVRLFKSEDEVAAFASNINTIIHGKVLMKYDLLGLLGDQEVVIFYLQRNDEFQELRNEFMEMIDLEELNKHQKSNDPQAEVKKMLGELS